MECPTDIPQNLSGSIDGASSAGDLEEAEMTNGPVPAAVVRGKRIRWMKTR